MANTFYAATKIKFGKRDEDGSQDGKYTSIVFEVGDEVKGLAKEDMQGLWDAGALTRDKPAGAKDADEDEEGPSGEADPKTPKPTKSTPAPVK